MLKAHEANRLSNERIAAQIAELLDEVEVAIRKECEQGKKNITFEVQASDKMRYDLMDELRRFGYYVSKTPAGRHLIFIRWC